MSEPRIATIVPRDHAPGALCHTKGTRVVLADGSELGRVTKITLVAEVNDLWRATIECLVQPRPITVEAVVEQVQPRINSHGEAVVTNLASTDSEFEPGAWYPDAPRNGTEAPE